MKHSKDRTLTNAQHRTLDRISRQDSGAKVVGWDVHMNGPVVRYSNGTKSVVGSAPRSDRPQELAA